MGSTTSHFAWSTRHYFRRSVHSKIGLQTQWDRRKAGSQIHRYLFRRWKASIYVVEILKRGSVVVSVHRCFWCWPNYSSSARFYMWLSCDIAVLRQKDFYKLLRILTITAFLPAVDIIQHYWRSIQPNIILKSNFWLPYILSIVRDLCRLFRCASISWFEVVSEWLIFFSDFQ